MTLKRALFTLDEIEQMDSRQKVTLYELQVEREKREKIEGQLLMAEAFQFSYIGSQPPVKKGQPNPGVKHYKRWRTDKLKTLYPDYYKHRPTIWDRFDKIKKSTRIN